MEENEVVTNVSLDREEVGRLTRTRSDSNSTLLDDSELDRRVLRILDEDEESLSLFNALYDDFKNDRIGVDVFYSELKTLCSLSASREIMELVKRNCPIEKYGDVEQFLLTTALNGLDMEKQILYNQTVEDEYDQCKSRVKEIEMKARESQRGLAKSHPIFKKCQRIRKCCGLIFRDIVSMLHEEECGYTINRLQDIYTSIDLLQTALVDALLSCDELVNEYDPLLDDEELEEIARTNHNWLIQTIKTSRKGELKRKKFTLRPRSDHSIQITCRKGSCILCYWKEANASRLLFSSAFLRKGKGEVKEV